MLFRRRIPLPIHLRLRDYLWPRQGLARSARYVAHRLGRMQGTPYRIAAGFAAGAAVSVTPFMGFHFMLAALLAWATRGNIFASAVGTVIGNPWTFPLFWATAYEIGSFMLGPNGRPEDLPQSLSISYIFDRPWEVFWPMAVGSLPMAVVTWLVVFLPLARIVDGYQRARRHRREVLAQRGRRRAISATENQL